MKHDQRPASPMLQLALALALALVLTPAALSCGPDRSGGKPEEHDVRLDSGAASHDLAFAGDSRCEVGGDGATAADAAPAQDGAAADALPDGSSSGDGEEAGMNPSDGGTVEDTGDGGTAPPRCRAALGEESPGSRHLADGVHRATVEPGPLDQATCRRSYRLATDAPLRDGLPANPRTVEEAPELPALRTGHAWFDALYALALAEMREDSVDSIHDGAFDADRPIPCPEGGCFETGRLWTYIWTRDIAYSVQLGLAALDPVRARNSLEFKLSTRRRGDDLQIVQDTGSGGSYPVSSDRVVWALGAWTLLQYLDGPERAAFFERAYTAIAGTLAHDREVVFDEREGLYRGEQSFLDWREQSYPPWTAQDTVHIAMSRALSTNAGHLAALEIATALAGERGEEAARQRFAGQAAALRETMHRRFWLAGPRLLSSFATTFLDPAPVQRHDLLGTALAVLADVLPAEQAAEVVARYPVLPKGPPVIWPQQQRTPIYHNRAIWPFATAYWLRAARKVGNAAAVEHGVLSLMRGAALNLSHMESFELVSGAPLLQDGEHTGPVVNSQRQLWSVAGYVSMVHDVVFGLEAGPQGIRFAPFVTPGLRRALFPRAGTLVLDRFPYRGKKLDVVVRLPPAEQELEQEQAQEHGGAYPVGAVRLDGRAVAADGFLAAPDLPRHGLLEIDLAAGPLAPAGTINLVEDTADHRALFGPRPPTIDSVALRDGKVRLEIGRGGEAAAEIAFAVYRDGALLAADLPGSATSWTDEATAGEATPSHCYALESSFVSSGNCSQRSAPSCFWGSGHTRVQAVHADRFQAVGGRFVFNHGRNHYEVWGDPGHRLTIPDFSSAFDGEHLLQVVYGNGAGPVSTGITCGIKRIVVEDAASGEAVGSGLLLMPHLGSWERWSDSSFVPVRLQAGRSYRITISDDDRTVNMSVFAHFYRYTGGTGGVEGPFSRVNIAELKGLALGR